jgi:hypothetical protein
MPEHFNQMKLLISLRDAGGHRLDYIEQDIKCGCFFIRTPGFWIASFADRWSAEDCYGSHDNISELSFIIGAPEVLNVKETEPLNVKELTRVEQTRFRSHRCCSIQ